MLIIEVTITNPLTSRLIMFALTVPDNMPYEQLKTLHVQFEQFNPDCHVNFEGKDIEPIYGMPVNMKVDQKRLSFNEFFTKWYAKTSFSAMVEKTAMESKGTSNTIIENIFEQIRLN